MFMKAHHKKMTLTIKFIVYINDKNELYANLCKNDISTTFFYRKEQVYMNERKIRKHQAFVITRVNFVNLQLLLADSLTIGSGVPQCLREAVRPIC